MRSSSPTAVGPVTSPHPMRPGAAEYMCCVSLCKSGKMRARCAPQTSGKGAGDLDFISPPCLWMQWRGAQTSKAEIAHRGAGPARPNLAVRIDRCDCGDLVLEGGDRDVVHDGQAVLLLVQGPHRQGHRLRPVDLLRAASERLLVHHILHQAAVRSLLRLPFLSLKLRTPDRTCHDGWFREISSQVREPEKRTQKEKQRQGSRLLTTGRCDPGTCSTPSDIRLVGARRGVEGHAAAGVSCEGRLPRIPAAVTAQYSGGGLGILWPVVSNR